MAPHRRSLGRHPLLSTEVVTDDERLGNVIDRVLASDPELQCLHRLIVRRQKALHRLVDDRAWVAYLRLEEVQTARLDLLLKLVLRRSVTERGRR